MKKSQESIDWLRALADNVPATSDPADVRDRKNGAALLSYIKELEDDIERRIENDRDMRYERDTRD